MGAPTLWWGRTTPGGGTDLLDSPAGNRGSVRVRGRCLIFRAVDASSAVLAHGLLNSVHVVASVPALLPDASGDEADRLCGVLRAQIEFLSASVDDLGEVLSTALRGELQVALFAADRLSEACHAGEPSKMTETLETLGAAAHRAAQNLSRLVRGLPPDVIDYLDALDGHARP
jgi:hypothetical protein